MSSAASFRSSFGASATLALLQVDVDAAADIAKEYSIRAMPTFILLKNGTKVDEVKGANAAA